jgi:Type II secretion system (T2SS), protein E, N-terminal domain
MDSEQTFRLIDQFIPFEVCLYHQVIPLSLEGSRLYLGMVDPEDYSALSYLRQLVGYLNCSLVPKEISLENHQALLSAYLNYTNRNKEKQRSTAASAATAQPSAQSQIPPLANLPAASLPAGGLPAAGLPNAPPKSGFVSEASSPRSTPSPTQFSPADRDSAAPKAIELKIHPHHLTSPVEIIAQLSPPQLLEELLGRVLMGGIGRLFFERQADRGRILWSQDGQLQSVLDNLSISTFQGVINELKRLTELPLIPVKQAKQVEIELLYQNDHLLLRFRVTRGERGEEGTLQVLRGAALKFYQQQKLTDLSRDALTIAQQLQKKLYEIRQQCDGNPNLSLSQSDVLVAIEQVLQQVNRDIQALHRNE